MSTSTNKIPNATGGKVLLAVLVAMGFLVLAVIVTRNTFIGVSDSMSHLSEPSPKIAALNAVYENFTRLEFSYQPLLVTSSKESADEYDSRKGRLTQLLDSVMLTLPFSEPELIVLDSVSHMITTQSNQLQRYIAVKRIGKPALRENLDSLVQLISPRRILDQNNVVTTRKSTKRIPITEERDEPSDKEENKSFWQKIFPGGDGKKAEPDERDRPKAILEETYTTVDTVVISKRDTSVEQAGALIKNITRSQNRQEKRSRDSELAIIQTSATIQNYLLTLIRDAEEKELKAIRRESERAENLMGKALGRMYAILAVFGVVAAVLIFAIFNDLAKARYFRKSLTKEKERAEELSKIKERFLANMSHEIRTPLQNILGYTEDLRKEDPNENIEIIYRSSEHLLQIVNEVLDFSKISTGKLTLHPKNIKLNELLTEVVRSMEIQADRRGIELFYDEDALEPLVFADPFRLRQLIYNLLGNAIKFTHRGHVKLAASTVRIKSETAFTLAVSDTGVGMSQEGIDRIFQEFEQIHDPSITAVGTGLGLSIVKALVDQYGGTIDVESEVGVGSIFTIKMSLPIAIEEPSKKSAQGVTKKMNRVLVVDDDQTILDLTERILKSNGISVVATTSPEDAEILATASRFDVMLVDYRMPGMTGAELRKRVKAEKPDLPVYAVTANVMQVEESEDEEFDGFLAKPFKAADLLRLLGHSPDERRLDPAQRLKAKLDSLTMGDEAAAAELILQFKTECQNDLKRLAIAKEERDAQAILELSHKLYGRLAFFEFHKLANRFRTMEESLTKSNSFELILEPLNKAEIALTQALKTVVA